MENAAAKTQTQQAPNQLAPVLMTPQKAWENIKDQFPEEAKVFADVIKKDIITLATDEAFALRDNSGEIRAFKQSLTLTAKAGTLTQPVPGSDFVVSAQGYEVWQEAAGACVIFPSEVLVDGKWQANPAVIRDERNGRILMIYARAVAFRFSSKGIPMVSDWTTIYDTPSYRMIDLLGKAKKTPQAFLLLPSEMKPKEEDGGTWAKYPFDEATNVWMNTAHPEALTWLGSIINREKKSIDFAQTFAKRNSLKHLSGYQKAPGPEWTIPVVCWRPVNGNIIKWDATQYAQLQAKVGKMISGDRSEFAQIEMQTGTEHVEENEDTEAIISEEMGPEDHVIDVSSEPKKEEVKQQKPEPSNSNLTAEEKLILSNLAATKEMFTAEYNAACQSLGIEPDADLSIDEAQRVYDKVSQMVE